MSVSLQGLPGRADEVTRALPHALGPEKSILSSMMQDPREYVGAALEERLTAEHFYLPAHALLFGVLVELLEAGQEIELVSLTQRLLDTGKLDAVGGPATLADVYTYAPSPAHFRHHCGLLREKRVLRGILHVAGEAVSAVYDGPERAAGLLDDIECQLTGLREAEGRSSGIVTGREALQGVLAEMRALLEGRREEMGVPTGYAELDRMCGGMKPGEMIVIAARPSMGKTSLMMNIVEHACLELGIPGMVFSCEMTDHQLASRLLHARAKFPAARLRNGEKPTRAELLRLKRAGEEIAAARLLIDPTSAITIGDLRAKARRKHREVGLGWIAIDYLQLMRSMSKQASGSREREIGEISAGIKALAKELGVPVLVLAQLNRDSEKRAGKQKGVPRMADLRESGSIEQDADVVGLLHRSDYFADDAEERAETAGRAKLIVAKNRNGETGEVPLTWIADLMRFETGAPVVEREWGRPGGSRYE